MRKSTEWSRRTLPAVAAGALLAGSMVAADGRQAAASQINRLIISEYFEGDSNNKLLELYNAARSHVNLADYSVQVFANGSTTGGTPIALSGLLPSGATYVIANTGATQSLLDLADRTSGQLNFNGDDAVVLSFDGTVVDVIGEVGFDPGTEWRNGSVGTLNDTMRRTAVVSRGDTNASDDFDPAVEWEGVGLENSTGVGLHDGGGAPPAEADFTGDGATDVAVYRPSTFDWFAQDWEGGSSWGTDGDVPVGGDFTGDGVADPTVFRPSDQTWYVRGGLSTQWGVPGDIPVPADYDGDGDDDVAVYRPSDQTWYSQGGIATQWGVPGDVPVPADYDGDGDDDVAVYRPSDQTWYSQGPGGIATQWGVPGDLPVPDDYDGDGDADVAVYRPSDQTWYVQSSGLATQWGAPGDVAVPGDYDGDLEADVAVFRPADATWYVQNGLATQVGVPGDLPVIVPHALRVLARTVVPLNETGHPSEADFCRLQFPHAVTQSAGTAITVYGRLFETGQTEPVGPAATWTAQVGVGPPGTDPRFDDRWSYVNASYNDQIVATNEDEYQASIIVPEPGSHRYVYRFSNDGFRTATYCDIDGAGSGTPSLTFDPNGTGTLTST